MSAHMLPAPALLGAFAVTAAVAWAAAGRRRGAPTIAGALIALQGALHLVFSLAGTHPAATHPHAGSGGTHAMHGAEILPATASAATSGTGTDGGTDTAGMLAVHLLAALLCGLWLAHGEAAFFTLARAALAYAFTPLRLLLARVRVPDAPRRAVRRTRRSTHRPRTLVLAHTLSRRGPPRPPVPRATALGAHV
ncbi:hypothetical protein AB0A76_33360 [Streptomyces exfoliatus]|uniref:Integral-membrane protein n=1 Tax=Streptomyces exfoliatus TaxID=1905 RepID=A0ABV3D6C4_STREX